MKKTARGGREDFYFKIVTGSSCRCVAGRLTAGVGVGENSAPLMLRMSVPYGGVYCEREFVSRLIVTHAVYGLC
jgi:hypothetical protein